MRPVELNVIPVPKPRMTQRDKWKPAAKRYFAFKDEVRWKALGERVLGNLPNEIEMCFVMPMPDSWTEKKKNEYDGEPHGQKPDIDNLVKALLDALYEEDKYVHKVIAEKCWGREGKIILGV